MLVAREDAVVISWDERGFYLADWQPVFLRGEKFKRSFQAVIDLTRARPGAPWIADASRMHVIDPADQDWITRWYFPEFARAGGRRQAGVLPEKRIAKLSTMKALTGVARDCGLELSGHATRAEAEAAVLAWLEKQADE